MVQELKGEKIDIVHWSDESAIFVKNTLSPAQISRVVVDEDEHAMEVIVPDDQLSLAIGKKGQNVRLAAKLTGWKIDIHTETDTKKSGETLSPDEALKKEFAAAGIREEKAREAVSVSIQALVDAYGIAEDLAARLVEAGYTTAEILANATREQLCRVPDLDEASIDGILKALEGPSAE